MIFTKNLPISQRGQELKEKPISAYRRPLARARQTLIVILRRIVQENADLTETDFLKEMDLGLLEGMTWEERRQNYPEASLDKKLSLLQAPCGESYQDVRNRCKIFTARDYWVQHPQRYVSIFQLTCRQLIRERKILLSFIFSTTFSQSYAILISKFQQTGGKI